MEISALDYKSVLNYYNISIPKKHIDLKEKAENILATKLCKCIKKVKKSNPKISEQEAIGICRKSVLHKKKLDVFKFKCKQKYKLEKGKQKSYKVLKYKKKNKTKKNK